VCSRMTEVVFVDTFIDFARRYYRVRNGRGLSREVLEYCENN